MSTSVGLGLSRNRDPYFAGKEAAYAAYQNLKDKNIAIAFVFATVRFNLTRLMEGIKSALGNIPLVGASGAGIITPDSIDASAVAIMLVASTKIKFAAACEKDLEKKDLVFSGQQLANNALKKLGDYPREAFIILSDGLIKNNSRLISGIKQCLGLSLPLIGGLAADDLTFSKTYQFFNYEVLTNSAVGILVGGSALIKTGIRHGWKPLGKPHIVTRSSGNIIHSIDERPAIGIYEDYLGKDNREIKKGEIIFLSVRYPLGIHLEGEREYLLRNAIAIDKDGSLICQADVPEGADIKLMLGTKESALEAASEAAQEITESLTRPLKFALVFDSFSRNQLLGRSAKAEIEAVKNKLGKDTPFIGLYTYGEQAPLKAPGYRGQSFFHNEAIAILAVGEQ